MHSGAYEVGVGWLVGWGFFSKFQINTTIDTHLSGSDSLNSETWWVKLLLAGLVLPWFERGGILSSEILAIPIKSRTPTVAQTSATVIETSPCLNLCTDKASVSAFMSYGEDKTKGTSARRGTENKPGTFAVPAVQTSSRQALGWYIQKLLTILKPLSS